MALSAEGYRAYFADASASFNLVAGTAPTTTLANMITVKNANYSIFVQRIIYSVSTSHADTIIFQDDASTPIVIAESPASPALGFLEVFDAGPRGFQLTEGKNLDGVGGAGPAGTISVEAYQKQTAVLDSQSGASNQ